MKHAFVKHVQVLNKGFWLRLGDEELFVSYEEFPWFKKATMEQISSIEWPSQTIFIGH